jgi:hypothetical protein
MGLLPASRRQRYLLISSKRVPQKVAPPSPAPPRPRYVFVAGPSDFERLRPERPSCFIRAPPLGSLTSPPALSRPSYFECLRPERPTLPDLPASHAYGLGTGAREGTAPGAAMGCRGREFAEEGWDALRGSSGTAPQLRRMPSDGLGQPRASPARRSECPAPLVGAWGECPSPSSARQLLLPLRRRPGRPAAFLRPPLASWLVHPSDACRACSPPVGLPRPFFCLHPKVQRVGVLRTSARPSPVASRGNAGGTPPWLLHAHPPLHVRPPGGECYPWARLEVNASSSKGAEHGRTPEAPSHGGKGRMH